MKPGILKIAGHQAQIGSDGQWHCPVNHLLMVLSTVYRPPDTVAGTPWVLAFWKAARELKGQVLQEPEIDPQPPGVIH